MDRSIASENGFIELDEHGFSRAEQLNFISEFKPYIIPMSWLIWTTETCHECNKSLSMCMQCNKSPFERRCRFIVCHFHYPHRNLWCANKICEDCMISGHKICSFHSKWPFISVEKIPLFFYFIIFDFVGTMDVPIRQVGVRAIRADLVKLMW